MSGGLAGGSTVGGECGTVFSCFLQSGSEGRQCFRADVVLNPFGILFGYSLRDAEGTKKLDDCLVALFALRRQLPSLVSEKNGAVWLRLDVAGLLEPSNGPVDSYVRHSQAPGEVHDARLTRFGEEVSDGFHIVFGDLVGMFAPDFGQVSGLTLSSAGPVTLFG